MSVVQTIIDNAMFQAQLKSSLSASYSDMAVMAATGTAAYTPERLADIAVAEPNVAIPDRAAGIDTVLFDSMYHGIITDLADRFTGFIDEYLTIDPALMTEAESWLKRAITDGGTGVNAVVEARIWQRSRDRIAAESATATDEAVANWAAKGYPLPPGAANASVQAIQRKRSAEVADVSREAAIKSFETEVANVKFAIGSAIDYRTKALSAAGDYIRALATAPNVAASMTAQSADAQSRLISSVASFYNARTGAGELLLRGRVANQDAELKTAGLLIDNARAYTDMRVRAVIAAAESLGKQAAAALNGINATSQLIESTG